MPRPVAAPRQRSFEDAEVPLDKVTFCAVDLETTSGSWKDGEIVEIGAVKSRGGEVVGTFETFVRPSVELPVEITMLTGIRPSMLDEAAPLPSVMPSFLEFLGSSVFVAHNARFDHSFLAAACRRLDYDTPSVAIIDTARLARRMLRDEVRNCRLQTLAAHFRIPSTPCHRAFPDAAACLEVLYELIARGSAYGLTTLADLLEFQTVRSNPHYEKVKMARKLPTTRGVYQFVNARGEIIYIGKAANLRARVRSYFTSDERKRMGDLRAEVADVRVIPCATEPHAAGLEARLIAEHRPRYNRRGVRRRTPVYLKLTDERHPRFSVVRSTKKQDGTLIGPFPSSKGAKAAMETLSGLFGVRTCTLAINGTPHEPCALYDLGSCHGPCTLRADDVASHDEAVTELAADLRSGLGAAAQRLMDKLRSLAERERFEEAAAHRDAYEQVARALESARRLNALRSAGRVELSTPDGPVLLDAGLLADADGDPGPAAGDLLPPSDAIEERRAVLGWFDRDADVRLESSERPLAYPWPAVVRPDRLGPPDDTGSGAECANASAGSE